MTDRRSQSSLRQPTPLRIVTHGLQRTVPATKNGAAYAGGSAQPRVLRQVVLVDREIDALRDIAVALRDEYEFHITISGTEALNWLRTGSIDTVIVGQNLYSSTGLNVLAQARQHAPQTHRVLLASAVEATAIQRGAAPAAPFKVLQRPCTADQLRELLASFAAAAAHAGSPPVARPVAMTATPQPQTEARRPTPDPRPLAEPRAANDDASEEDFEHVVLETPPDRQRLAKDASRVPVLIYTDNSHFYRAVAMALRDVCELRLCTQLDRAIELAEEGQCPIVITDRAATQVELQRISIPLRALDAAMVTIAAGPLDVAAALRRFLGTGALHSFINTPVNPAQVRMVVQAAQRHYLTSKFAAPTAQQATATLALAATATATRTGSYYVPNLQNNYHSTMFDGFDWRRIGRGAGLGLGIVVALGLTAAGAWWGWQAWDARANRVQAIAIEMALASKAVAEGRYAMPAGDSAIDHYRAVLARRPDHGGAQLGLEQALARLVDQAEQALIAERLDEANQAIEAVAAVQPNNRRLAYLRQQLVKDRNSLIRTRPTNASLPAATARPAVPAALDLPRSPIARWLALGQQRLAEGRLLMPENDSAEFYFREVERMDPSNPAIRPGLRDIGTRLLAAAREAMSRQQLDLAKQTAAEAERFGVDPAAVRRLQQEVDGAASSVVRANLLRMALRRTRDNQLFEPERDSAKHYVAELRRLHADSAETQQAARALLLKLVDNAEQATALRQLNAAAQLLAEARRLEMDAPELTAAEERLRGARAPTPEVPAAVASARPPKLLKAQSPRFPDEAARAGVEGWVDVGFIVNAGGEVIDAAAVASQPASGPYAGAFERNALLAIRQYRFEARTVDEYVPQRSVVRVQFRLQQNQVAP
jgi:periplasmic protein TonB